MTITRDKSYGVPHIYGSTREGVMFGTGYAAAEDRLFLIDVLRHAARAELSSFKDGKYGFSDIVENDGIERKPYTVAIDLYVQGDEVVADYSRSSTQAKGPINALREDYENPQYLAAVNEFYRRYVCRLPVWPREVVYSFDHLSKPVYYTMNGPNEFTIIGTIRDWDVTDQLPKIRLPTLVTVGRYDEVTPHVAEAIHRGIRGSRLVRFEKSAHLAMWEERAKYIGVVRDFLDGVRP